MPRDGFPSAPYDAANTNAPERQRILAGGGILRQHAAGKGVAWRVGETGLAVTRAMGKTSPPSG